MAYQPIIILGAGRSGTNMLRDALCCWDQIATWPCDEINYIWRHGHARYPTDALTPTMATDDTCRWIRRQFQKRADQSDCRWVLEKTCANTLRLPFVHAVLPDAKFIHIVRDGRDVAASASERWQASLDIPYLLKKARYVPLTDLPYYAIQYGVNRLKKIFGAAGRLSVWGPRFDGYQQVFTDHPLHVACAIQWQRCVDATDQALSQIPAQQQITLHYESFVADPAGRLQQLIEFIGHPPDARAMQSASGGIRSRSVGRWRQTLDPTTVELIHQHVGQTLGRHGYTDTP